MKIKILFLFCLLFFIGLSSYKTFEYEVIIPENQRLKFYQYSSKEIPISVDSSHIGYWLQSFDHSTLDYFHIYSKNNYIFMDYYLSIDTNDNLDLMYFEKGEYNDKLNKTDINGHLVYHNDVFNIDSKEYISTSSFHFIDSLNNLFFFI